MRRVERNTPKRWIFALGGIIRSLRCLSTVALLSALGFMRLRKPLECDSLLRNLRAQKYSERVTLGPQSCCLQIYGMGLRYRCSRSRVEVDSSESCFIPTGIGSLRATGTLTFRRSILNAQVPVLIIFNFKLKLETYFGPAVLVRALRLE